MGFGWGGLGVCMIIEEEDVSFFAHVKTNKKSFDVIALDALYMVYQ